MDGPSGDRTLAFRREQALRADVESAITKRISGQGSFQLRLVPDALSSQATAVMNAFAALSRPFDDIERAHLVDALRLATLEAQRHGGEHRLRIEWRLREAGKVEYSLRAERINAEENYAHWLTTEKGELFGKAADRKLVEVVESVTWPQACVAIDIGAGLGRNALWLAARGFSVIAVEPCSPFADALEQTRTLDVRQSRILDEGLVLPDAAVDLAIASQIVPHLQNTHELGAFLKKVGAALRAGAHLVLSTFLPDSGYDPEPIVRDASVAAWSTVFTREELLAASGDAELDIVSTELAVEFEQSRTDAGSWPPSRWFAGWARGGDVFGRGDGPIQLYWVHLVKKDAAPKGLGPEHVESAAGVADDDSVEPSDSP